MNQNEFVIITDSLKKNYKENGIEVKAVRGVNLKIKKREFSAIVGPSGSGKTTLLNLISGLDIPDDGKIWLNNKLLSEMSGKELSDFRRDHIGFIFQAYNLIPVLTVKENIEYIMLLQGVEKKERHKKVLNILREVGLEGMETRVPTKLSGGQQQRVAIARAMVSNPSLILADEPTANLDSKTSGELLNMMRRLNETTGMTFLFSTHDKMIMEKARRVITLKDGLIEKDEIKD
jgi:putative ABC transport system ATP-binding protein